MIDRNDLHALADNELEPQQRAALLDQLKNDSQAEAEYQSILAMKAVLKTQMEQPDTAELWSKCRGRLDELDKTRRVESFVGRYAWGICGFFIAAILLGGVFNRATGRSVQPNEVAGYVAGLSPVSVPRDQNQAELEPELRQVVGSAFEKRPAQMVVTAIGRSTLSGGRTSYVQLSDPFGTVAVVALHDVKLVEGLWDYEPNSNFKCAKVDGVNALFWNRREDGAICMVVGMRSYDELYGIVQAMCPKN
jgi:hypothetical protein